MHMLYLLFDLIVVEALKFSGQVCLAKEIQYQGPTW